MYKVTSKTTFDTTVCRCKHLTNFGGGFFVAPNPIDFDAAFKGFTDIASNPIVFATVLTIFGLYFIGVIWARWRDKEDLQKVTCAVYKYTLHLVSAARRDLQFIVLI